MTDFLNSVGIEGDACVERDNFFSLQRGEITHEQYLTNNASQIAAKIRIYVPLAYYPMPYEMKQYCAKRRNESLGAIEANYISVCKWLVENNNRYLENKCNLELLTKAYVRLEKFKIEDDMKIIHGALVKYSANLETFPRFDFQAGKETMAKDAGAIKRG